MTKQQIENGECKDDDGNDNSIELYSKKDDMVPGFLKKGTHPDKCVPCCFDEWNKLFQCFDLKLEKDLLEK